MLDQLKNHLRPPVVIGLAVVLALLAVGITYGLSLGRPSGAYITPTVGSIIQEVDTPGTVDAADSLDLSFQVGGRIVNDGPAVGTHVSAGATLATLSEADANAALEQAQAALAVQQANLAALQAGTRPEDIAVAQTAVTGAQSTLAQSKESLRAAAEDAYVKADDAIHNKVDQFINNPRTATPTLPFPLRDSQMQSSLLSGRVSMEASLTAWQSYSAGISNDADSLNVDDVTSQTRSYLQQVGSYLDSVAQGLTEVVYTTGYPVATIEGYQTNIQTARTNISTALSTLASDATAEKNAEAALASAQSQLQLKQAGATPQAIQAQEAQVAVAQANVDAAKAQLSKLVINAPISGTITVNNAHVGEITSPSAPLISMISDTKFQMDDFVSQADLAKLRVGDIAAVTLDAYQGGDTFPAHVIAIDPAATIQNGVSSYKVTLQFDNSDPRIQAGLTGNAKITTKNVADALSVPTSAIITSSSDHFVLRKSGSSDVRVPVQVGIASADGFTQILSGIAASDQIRTFGNQ